MKKFRLLWLIVIIVAIILSVVAGCKGDFSDYTDVKSVDGYRMLTVRTALASFSFEYSAYYKREGPMGDLEHVRPFVYVDLLAPKKGGELLLPADKDRLKTSGVRYVPAAINVGVNGDRDSPPVFQNAGERTESVINNWSKWENFKLLERSPVTISGVKGEMITYVVDWWFAPVPKGEVPTLQYHRAVYFDHNGLIWVIEAKSEMEMADRVKADFDHIIQTFKFID